MRNTTRSTGLVVALVMAMTMTAISQPIIGTNICIHAVMNAFAALRSIASPNPLSAPTRL